MNPEQKIYCGVDVSKKDLDAFMGGKTIRFTNTVKGICSLMKQAGDVHYVFESTGGYERPAAWHLLAQGRTVSIVNPGRVREYAKSIGQIAKTDRIDAQVITRFAELVHPRKTELPSADHRKLTVLVERRQQLMDMLIAEGNRLETAGEPELLKMIQKHRQWLQKQILQLEQSIESTISGNAEMKQKAARIKSIKGLGNVSAATLLAVLPEIGTLSRKEVAALAGVAPYNRDSGTFRGQRHICGGRKRLRATLYMAAVCASHSNAHLAEFYNRLVNENHRPKKVALTAVMRKILIAANSAVKNPEFLIAA
jgi:transposase